MLIRLQKILAEAGVASRRRAEGLIAEGRVEVDGKVVRELGAKADPDTQAIVVDGKPITHEKKIYIKLYKPRGYISSNRRNEGDSVLELVKVKERVYPVGRLDKDSEGLLILTNDGAWALKMTHPRFEHEKEYVVKIEPAMSDTMVRRLSRTVAKAELKNADGKTLTVILKEGKKRQIRETLKDLGFRVVELKRVRMGTIELGTLKPGEWGTFTL